MLSVAVPLSVAGVLGLWASYGGRAGGIGTGVVVLKIAGTALFAFSAVFWLPWTLVMIGFYGASLGSLLSASAVVLRIKASVERDRRIRRALDEEWASMFGADGGC